MKKPDPNDYTAAEKKRIDQERRMELAAKRLKQIEVLRGNEAFGDYFVGRLQRRAEALSVIALRGEKEQDREDARLRFLEVDSILQWMDEDEAGWKVEIEKMRFEAQRRPM
jgi:hypothetical protein